MPSVRLRLPYGWKFTPTDEELVLLYLLPKCRGENISGIPFSEDVYDKPPSQFCTDSTDRLGKHYFFTDLTRPNKRASRSVGTYGFWHENSKTKIEDNNNKIIGYKKLLNYRLKSEPKKNTEWSMHEFSPYLNEGESKNLVVCVIQNKEEEKGTGSFFVLDLDSGSGSGWLEIAGVKSCSVEEIAEAERGTGGLDQTVPQSDEEMAEAERGTGGLHQTVSQSGENSAGWGQLEDLSVDLSILPDSTTTANEDPSPAQDEETQQSNNMNPPPDYAQYSAISDIVNYPLYSPPYSPTY